MTAEEVIQRIRDLYVAELLNEYAALIDEGIIPDLETEALGGDGACVREGPLRLPFRFDLSWRGNTGGREVRRVASQTMVSFQPFSLTWRGGIELSMEPFLWDMARFRISKPANWDGLRGWYLDWFRPRPSPEEPDLMRAVHDLTGPEDTEEGAVFDVDFGAAPVAAFDDLVDMLARAGCKEVAIGGGVIGG